MTELTNELIYDLCGYLEDGNYRSVACQLCGFTEEQLDEWLANASKDKMCEKLKKDVLWAEAEAERGAVYSLVTAGKEGDVKAIMEFLKNKYPERWNKDNKASAVGDNDLNIAVQIVKSPHKSNLTAEELEEIGNENR